MILSRPPQPAKFAKAVTLEEKEGVIKKETLISKLLKNDIRVDELEALCRQITPEDLSNIIQRIYDLNEKYILELSAVEGMLRRLNAIKNAKRNGRFIKKINAGFRDLKDQKKKIILAEGDSWFNYPVVLTDLIDRIGMEDDFALYSLASGGDWFLNMLTGRQYVEQLSLLHPDVFLISGGGNDLVGSRRLAAIVEPKGSEEYEKSEWAQFLIKRADKKYVPLSDDFNEGVKYLSRDFFALLMFFHLQYSYLINGMVAPGKDRPAKFPDMTIVTQGYDFAIPSDKRRFGVNPMLWYVPFIRTFLGHGGWLRTPLQMRGIRDSDTQRKIIYAMIYLFNEMMINVGRRFSESGVKNVFHIDSRGTVGADGWTDELHVKPRHAFKIGEEFIHCIRGSKSATYGNVYVVNPRL